MSRFARHRPGAGGPSGRSSTPASGHRGAVRVAVASAAEQPERSGIMACMRLPVMPPVKPMLARSVKDIPGGDMSYEPKWDGFRSIVFRDGDEVVIGSRNGRPMTRYFPEVVEAIGVNLPERCVLDGEIVV